jgi:signal peptidase I
MEEKNESTETNNSELNEKKDDVSEIKDSETPVLETPVETGEIEEEKKKNHAIHKQIIIRYCIFVLCSLIYLFLIYFGGKNRVMLELDATPTVKIMRIVMIACYIICGAGLLIILFGIIAPRKFHENLDKITYKQKNVFFNFLDWGMIFPICAVISTSCFCFLFIITPVDGSSMMPNIVDGERVFVSYLEKKDRFDVIVAEITPEDNFECYEDSRYIKRIIGLPGDELTWINNTLYIKEKGTTTFKEYDEPYLGESYLVGAHSFQGTFFYKENGVEKTSTVIPEGYYFVMGDNRGISKDSRMIGLIPFKNVIGVAKYHMGTFFSKGKIV